jgi:hypothetical protein
MAIDLADSPKEARIGPKSWGKSVSGAVQGHLGGKGWYEVKKLSPSFNLSVWVCFDF